MRLTGLAFLLGPCLMSLSASAALNVAILDYQDGFTVTKGLGQLLADVGQAYTDKTTAVQGGQAIDLTGFDTFIIGSFCTQQATIKSQLAAATTTLRNFVNNGGTIITLTQADQTVANEAWVLPPAVVTRADPDFDAIYRVQAGHQLFNVPNAITDVHLAGWQYVGTSTWSGSWESFSTFQQVGVLAGDDPAEVGLATILEAGWGSGRVLFLSMAPDKARNIGNTQAKAQAPRLMRNLLEYAANVKAHTASPVVIYANTGWAGPIAGRVFRDGNGNGSWDQGESGIGGVGVSDSIDLVLTAADGTYTLPNTAGNARLLYISVPSGYSKNARWYQRLSSASSRAELDFALTPVDESQPFDFVQITDLHIGGNGTKALMTSALAEVAALKTRPAFILATGDLVNTGGTLSQYDDYSSAVAASQVKVFSVFGNHDANNGGTTNYRRYLGPDYYSFSTGDCHFLVVNSVYKPAVQTNWIARNLQLLRGTKRLFVFQHYSPSQQEHTEYSGYGTKAVFTGHWHSQHSVGVGQTASYNSPTFLFGGIDCSPAGFKVIHVGPAAITTRMRWIADGKRLTIVTPANSILVCQDDVSIIVNAYQTAAEIISMTYEVKADGIPVASGSLIADGAWSWKGLVPADRVPRGGYELQVTTVNDRGEVSMASTTFTVLGIRKIAPAPQQDWTQFGGGPERGGATTATLSPPLGPVWCRNTGGTLDFASPVLKAQTIYIGVKDRRDFANNGVLALRAGDGSQAWFAPTPAAVSHSVAVDDSRVYACSHGGILHGFNRASGAEVWSKPLGSTYQRFQYGAPVLVGDRIYAGTFAYFGSFAASDGAPGWNKNYGADWISCNACPAVKGTTLLVPGNWDTNSLRAVSTATGTQIWQYTVGGLHGSPVISGDRVVFTDYDGQIHCANLTTGVQHWKKALGGGRSASTPAVAYGVVVAGGTGSIKGFRLSDGFEMWNRPIGTSALKMAPYNNGFAALAGSATIADHTAYVPCGDGKLYALTLETGEVLWSMDFGTPILSAPCISGHTMFLSAFDGNVYALSDKSGFSMPADFDNDLDVDQHDFGYMQLCLTETGLLGIAPGCEQANLNGDALVDGADMLMFLACMSAPNQPLASDCYP